MGGGSDYAAHGAAGDAVAGTAGAGRVRLSGSSGG